jgi:hypothetical protein
MLPPPPPVSRYEPKVTLTISIGVAITQLFRLSPALYTLSQPQSPTSTPTPTSSGASPVSGSLPSSVDPTLLISSLALAIAQQSASLAELGTQVNQERNSYAHLGKPIGATFVALAVAFLVIGMPHS